MMGKPDGARLLDVSADGFWSSFFAIVVALPALAISWVKVANELSPGVELSAARNALLPGLAFIDLCTWLVPLVGLALVARLVGIGDRFVHYVVASNWGTVITAWIMLPAALLSFLVPSTRGDLAIAVGLALFVLSMVLSWRLTNAVLNKGPAVASAVFAAMFLASLAVSLALQSLFGIAAE